MTCHVLMHNFSYQFILEKNIIRAHVYMIFSIYFNALVIILYIYFFKFKLSILIDLIFYIIDRNYIILEKYLLRNIKK